MAKRTQRASKLSRNTAALETSPNNGNGTKSFEVGTTVQLPDEDASTLESAEQRILSLQASLGALVVDFESKKALALRQIEEARKEYHSLIMGIGRKHEISLGPGSNQDWRFMPDKKAYERVA